MPKVNRKPGIHLHKTKVRVGSIKSNMATKDMHEEQWYWILIARNGKTIARSSETYKRKGTAVRSIEIVSDIMRFGAPGSYYDHSGEEVKQFDIKYKEK